MKKKVLWTKIDTSLPFLNLTRNTDEDIILDEEDSDDEFQPQPNFDVYRLQTNFKLDTDSLYLISDVPGVEQIQPVSPYQIIVCLPNSGFFNQDKIKQNIGDLLTSSIETSIALSGMVEYEFSPEVADSFLDIVNSLQSTKANWIVYLYPNAEFEIITDFPSDEYFNTKLVSMALLHQSIGGFLAHSELY